jgi:hypothetical protein
VSTFVDRGVSRGQRGGSPTVVNLSVHAPTEDKTDDVKDSFYEDLERIFDKFSKHHMKILLGDINAKVLTMFPHRSIHKYTWTSPDGKTHKQMDHIPIDRQRHSSVFDVRSFMSANCDTDRSLSGVGKD